MAMSSNGLAGNGLRVIALDWFARQDTSSSSTASSYSAWLGDSTHTSPNDTDEWVPSIESELADGIAAVFVLIFIFVATSFSSSDMSSVSE